MDVHQPRVRRRGFFLHSSDGDSDTGEHENPEGFIVRFPGNRSSRKIAGSSRGASVARFSGGRSHRTDARPTDGPPGIRSGSVTGSRQRAHLPR
jgi:hypothetical protein